jgi:sialate O-acetylesterase
MGEIPVPDFAAEMADLVMRLEGVQWALCMGVYKGTLILSLRTNREGGGAGDMIQRIVRGLGKAGGHGLMAGGKVVQIPTDRTSRLNLVDSIRRDTGIADLPFIYVQISRCCVENHDTATGWEVIRDKQRRVANMRKNLFVLPAIDLPLDDLIHIGTAGQQRLGRRMAEVALDKVYGLPGHATTIDCDSYEILPALDPLHNKMRVRFTGVNGRLQAKGRPSGFEFKPEDPNRDGPVVFKVDLDPKDPSSAIVWYSKEITSPVKLYYGLGINPYCNIVDSKDMAIPAFGPITIEPKR